MARKSGVRIALNLPFDIQNVLLKTERKILEDQGKKAVDLIRAEWVGWKYGTQYKPPRKYLGKPGTSRDGWAVRELEGGNKSQTMGITVFNDATVPDPPSEGYTRGKGENVKKLSYSKKGVGKKYAAYVHRAGEKVTKGSVKNREWIKMRAMLKKEWLPEVVKQLRDAIMEDVGQSKVQLEIEANKASETDYLVIK